MSWLAGIAGKAEELLNKVDQAAATSLNTSGDEGRIHPGGNAGITSATHSAFPNHSKSHSSGGQLTGVTGSISSSASVPTNLNKMNSSQDYLSQMSKSTLTTSRSVTKPAAKTGSNTKIKDDELFEFLNSSESTSESKRNGNGRPKTLLGNKQHSRQSSAGSSAGSRGRKTPDGGSVEENTSSPGTPGGMEGSDSPDHASLDIHGEQMTRESSSGYQSNPDDSNGTQQQLSSLELENRLLKNEVASLNQEMTSVIQRAKTAQDELVQVKKQLQAQTHSHSQSDQIIRELRARESDMTEALSTKDAQLGILRVRLEEADKELKEKKKTVEALSAEKDRVLQDHTTSSGVHGQALDSLKETLRKTEDTLRLVQYSLSNILRAAAKAKAVKRRSHGQGSISLPEVLQDHTTSSGVHGQALDSLKEKLHETEDTLRREQESLRLVQQESMQRQSKYETEQQSLAESLNTAQRKVNDERTRVTELSTQLKTAKSQVEDARKELNDYKEKASRILQSKDKLISSLKEGTMGGDTAEHQVSSAELEECRQEKDMYRDELNQQRMTVESLRTEIQDLEMQLQTESEALHDQVRSLEDQLSTEKQRREDAEQENTKQKQELRYAHEELVKQKTEYKNRIQDREAEIERLRNQLTTKSFSTTSQTELENRLHALTESLIQKQTMLEALSTEKNSLGLQLERLEAQYKDMHATSVRANATHVAMNGDDDEVRQRLPGFMTETPLDGDVTRRVKRYANSIDKFSIRLGVFLRRYPIARVFVIVYMVLLHFWVMIVLLTYKPEMHETDYQPLPPGQNPARH